MNFMAVMEIIKISEDCYENECKKLKYDMKTSLDENIAQICHKH